MRTLDTEKGHFTKSITHLIQVVSMTNQGFPKLTYATQTLKVLGVQFPLEPIRLKKTSTHGRVRHLRPPQNIRWFERSLVQHPLLLSSLPLCRWSGPLSATWMAVWASVFWVFSVSIVSLNSANSDSCRERERVLKQRMTHQKPVLLLAKRVESTHELRHWKQILKFGIGFAFSGREWEAKNEGWLFWRSLPVDLP